VLEGLDDDQPPWRPAASKLSIDSRRKLDAMVGKAWSTNSADFHAEAERLA
jgi:hypothetical protein